MGKSSINGSFSMAMLNNQMVNLVQQRLDPALVAVTKTGAELTRISALSTCDSFLTPLAPLELGTVAIPTVDVAVARGYHLII